MMPTLFDGDFIFVSKYSYGLRLPVINTLLVPTGTPQRGDVIVFRLPPNPKINYIKRLVGLPGDRIRVDENNLLYVNGSAHAAGARPDIRRTEAEHVELRRGAHRLRAARSQAPPDHVCQGQRHERANGWCPPATISSWATTATTARTAAGRTIRMRRASFRSRIWSVKRCESGLISILVTDLSGDGSAMRFNKRLFREAIYAAASARHDIHRAALHPRVGRGDRYAGIRLVPVYLNYMKVARTLDATATEFKGDNPDPAAIRRSLDRHWEIEDITGRRCQGHRDHQGRGGGTRCMWSTMIRCPTSPMCRCRCTSTRP